MITELHVLIIQYIATMVVFQLAYRNKCIGFCRPIYGIFRIWYIQSDDPQMVRSDEKVINNR